jgi:restriction system protein
MAQQPNKSTLVNPVLKAIKQLGGSATPREVYAAVAKDLGLEGSPVLEELQQNGVPKFNNNIAFVRFYLVQAGYLDSSTRGVWTLTDKGRNAPILSDAEINQMFLDIRRQAKKVDDSTEEASERDEEEDVPEAGYKAQLLAILRTLPPSGFERLCQRLLREAGFEQVVVTGRPGDGGIDGNGDLRVNPLVTFKVVFQCKRYVGTVGAPDLRNFRGSMQGKAEKGLFLTTGSFSSEAKKEAVRDGVIPIELVDGEKLVELFGQLKLGMVPRPAYDVDVAFFTQFQKSE